MAEQAKLFCSETRVILMQDLKRKGIPSSSFLSTMSLTSHSHIHTRHIVLEYVLLVWLTFAGDFSRTERVRVTKYPLGM